MEKNMKKATLVIMAAGIGSRFGGGIKQLEPVGPNGEIIMDYSIYDAMEAGFNKIVFVIRRDLEEEFKEVIGNRIEKVVEVAYAFQELDDIPEQFQKKFTTRKKPWGTGQAILCCKDIVKEPFLVINADDYYGKEAYRVAYRYLTEEHTQSEKLNICMVGFVLRNTLSENGTVTRGVCKVDKYQMLTDIEETYGIKRSESCVVAEKEGKETVIDLDSPVSMNMWGFPVEFIRILERGFIDFLKNLDPENVKAEYLLPQIIGNMLKKQEVRVKVLRSHDKWFGVTYKEDKEDVVAAIKDLISEGVYPNVLFEKER